MYVDIIGIVVIDRNVNFLFFFNYSYVVRLI